MININVKPTAIEGGGEFETIPEGIYNVELIKFEEWVPGVDRNKNPYHRAKFRLKITDGPFENRQIMDSLFVGVNTPSFVLGNFLTSFTDGETLMNASDFKNLVGQKGRCSIEHKEVTKKVRDKTTGIEEEVTSIYENVKNFLKKEKIETPNWNDLPE